jgi:hypothetical protein
MIVGAAKARLSSKDAPEPGTEPKSRLGASQKTSRDLRGQNRRGARGRPTEIEILPEHGAPEQGDGTGSGTDESVD